MNELQHLGVPCSRRNQSFRADICNMASWGWRRTTQKRSVWVSATSRQAGRQSHLPAPWGADPGGMAGGSAWDAVGGSSLPVPPCLVAAALCKPTSRCGWSFCRCEADAKQHVYLLACINHPLALPAVGQGGGDRVRRGPDPHWPLYCSPPAL